NYPLNKDNAGTSTNPKRRVELVGNTPERTSDDLPTPLIPSTSTNGVPSAAWARSAVKTSPMALVRPKNIGACSKSKNSRPRNGEPLVQAAVRLSDSGAGSEEAGAG